MAYLFHGVAPIVELRVIEIHTIAFCPLIRRVAVDDGIGRYLQGIIRTATEFTAFHRCYLLLYVVDAGFYIITAVGSTYS